MGADVRHAGSLRLLIPAGLAGTAVMLMELTATRALAPAFGASLYTWTNVIAVVLAALTLGYLLGGRLADRRPQPQILGWILLAAAFLSLPAPFLTVPLGEWLLPEPEALNALTSMGHMVRGSLVTSLLLFAPPLLLLGMVGPFVCRCLMDGGLGGGTATGRTLAVSTLGSLVGTFLPAHFLIEHVGSRGTLLVASGLLLLAAMPLLVGRGRWVGLAALALVVVLEVIQAGLPIRMPLPGAVGEAHEVSVRSEFETPYQYVRVSRWEGFAPGPAGQILVQRRLSLDEGVLEFHSLLQLEQDAQGTTHMSQLTGGMYYDMFALLPELVADSLERPVDVAILGGGAGTMGRMLRLLQGPRVGNLVSIEIDPQVAALHTEFGWEPGARDHLVMGDGRVMLRRLDHRFDLVILDAYARQIAIPAHLATREFFQLVRRRLSQRGLLALNLSIPDLDGPLSRALQRTLALVFPRVEAVAIPGVWNVLLLASSVPGQKLPAMASGPLQATREAWRKGYLELDPVPQQTPVLTDDRAPLEQLARRT